MRSSGILMHISSLPSPYGIGTLGAKAREFTDFLLASGQTYWQILPICPTSFGDSPYQSFSTFAGNPYFIDLDDLCQEGLLDISDYQHLDWCESNDSVDYGRIYNLRFTVLHKAYERFSQNPTADFYQFCSDQGFWLEDYALFMTLKDSHGGAPWQDWSEELRRREPQALEDARQKFSGNISFWKVCQYLFFKQWRALKAYANERGISIIGDLPIYVAGDSVDVWANVAQFQLDENLVPTHVAGCPPDGFSAEGQLWGTPLFDWEIMEQDGFSWWLSRIRSLIQIYDMLRIDHFRGFDSYYAISYGMTDARIGEWRQGPGMALFNAISDTLGPLPIIAEDLGFLTDSVRKLLVESGFPGMKVLEFAFDSRDENDSDYLPHNYPHHCIAYTGTHDNETALGWMEGADPADVELAKEYLNLTETEGYGWGMMRGVWSSSAERVIVQMQDVLELGKQSRMNIPATLGNNWKWRAEAGSFTDELAKKLKRKMKLYGR